MAVAVIEREKINSANALKRADEVHNSRIKSNYAMLINPDVKLDDLLGRNECQTAAAVEPAVSYEPSVTATAAEVTVNKPYLVENARADSVLFRADNPLNRRTLQTVQENAQTEEEENEDLRPTPTTIQYQSAAIRNTVEEGKINNVSAEKRTRLSKKEKIIIAVVVSVIVALFALIIINSAIISNLNSDIGSLQSSLTDVTRAYSGISGQVDDFKMNIFEKVEEFAQFNNMIKIS